LLHLHLFGCLCWLMPSVAFLLSLAVVVLVRRLVVVGFGWLMFHFYWFRSFFCDFWWMFRCGSCWLVYIGMWCCFQCLLLLFCCCFVVISLLHRLIVVVFEAYAAFCPFYFCFNCTFYKLQPLEPLRMKGAFHWCIAPVDRVDCWNFIAREVMWNILLQFYRWWVETVLLSFGTHR
jgi:hypothetical protein